MFKNDNNLPQDGKRNGWAAAFREMAKNGDDELVMPDVFEDEDFSAGTTANCKLKTNDDRTID